MKDKSLLILLLLLMIAMGIYHSREKESTNSKSSAGQREASSWTKGKKAIDFNVKLLNGQDFSLSEKLGKNVVLIYFTASWCSPCKIMTPEIKHLCEEYKGKPFTMVALFIDQHKDEVEKAVREYGYPYPSISAVSERELTDKYDIKGVPTFILIGKDGKTLFCKTGMIRNVDVTLKPIIDKELNKTESNVVFEIKFGGSK
ncbi:TlpA family protein disulfide reductase [bacterium]|nr:TlpA family protein disulfide reductase [bacterium]